MHITFKQTFKMVRKFAVVLSQPSQGVFHPGSELEGKLTFELSEPKAYHYIKVAIIGEARVYHGDKHQSIHRQYINSQVIVWSKEQAIDGRLQSGPHSFPFQYTLPNRLHSSLFVPTCRCVIRYYVEGRIGTGGGKFDHTIRVDFPVVELVDVNLPVLQRPIRGVVQKTIGSWFCASGQIRLTAECPRRGYSIGEGISLKVIVENGSRRQIQILVRLWRIAITKFHFDKKSILNYLTRSPVPAGRSEILHFEDHLRVPPTIPRVASCDIFELKYVLQVTAVIPWSINSSVRIPLTIGNIPLRDPRQDVSDPPPPPVSSSRTHPQQGSPSKLTTDPPPPYELAYQY